MRSVLTRPSLVLNRNWQPVGVAPVARALVMVWNETARIVDPDDFRLLSWHDWAQLRPRDGEPFIQTVRFRLRVPEVVSLVNFDRVPTCTVAFNRRNLFKRDRYTCQYCGTQPGSEELTIDHILPRSRGGVSSWENCVLACVNCNKRKADRTPPEAHMRLRVRPVRPNWRPLYAEPSLRIASWRRFVSEAYWNVELHD
ncbi:MAG: HNH endonuclease [Planctomycetota bacterium]